MQKRILSRLAVGAILLWNAAPAAYASAPSAVEDDSNFGFISIREPGVNMKATEEPYDMSGHTLGILHLSPFQLPKVTKQGTDDQVSASAQKIMSELQPVEEAHKKGDWATALAGMRALYTNHPDLPFFGKWVAIYQNRTHNYKESLATMAQLREAWPLDKEIQNSFVSDYYMLDNVRRLGDQKTADRLLALMKDKMQKTKANSMIDGTLDSVMKDEKTVNTLLSYQELMLSMDATGEVSKPKLDKLWESIPKGQQKSLDRYYGFDLSDLEYVYGMTYARKDVLSAYVQQHQYDYDAGTILRIRNAKKIIYGED